ncbi:MAG: hypothetical protein CL942_04210 [Desulfovibrio sp.]|nr:hypothetical protein [Desulfovibrio sp.]|tara:strand:+ start:25490 stop:26020 length:531 start_codon:yes stop_codon:yes gene_type:complete
MEITNILQNISLEITGYWWTPIRLIAALIGLWFLSAGVKGFTDRQGEPSRKIAAASIFVGTCLLNFQSFLNMMSVTFLGKETPSQFWYSAKPEIDAFLLPMGFSLVIIQFFGYWYVIKALIMFRETPRQGDARQVWQSWGHLIGGFACVYVGDVLSVISYTVGGDFSTLISKLNIT